MRIAIPIVNGEISEHFGHCEEYYIYDTDADGKAVAHKETLPAPPHQPGLLPRWLRDRGADAIITKGIGSRAVSLFEENDISVVTGAITTDPDKAASDYLSGCLETRDNVCDH